MTNKEAVNVIMLLRMFFKEEAKFSEALKIACELLETTDETAEWVGVAPQTDSEQCSSCGYNIQSEELRTPHCPWCGKKMKNFPCDSTDKDKNKNTSTEDIKEVTRCKVCKHFNKIGRMNGYCLRPPDACSVYTYSVNDYCSKGEKISGIDKPALIRVWNGQYCCPNCELLFGNVKDIDESNFKIENKSCRQCGQKLDWSISE